MPLMENFILKIEFRESRHENYRPLWKYLILKISDMKNKIK